MKPRKFAAFISYSHSDAKFAARLHRRIEAWRTPSRLLAHSGRDGSVVRRLFPVFRDREELPTSSDLGGAIRTALENSAYLIVVCSPRSAMSIWVDQEVLEFKRMHGEGRIIAAIVEGEPAVSFPPSLRRRIGQNGDLTDEPTEPIAADFRQGKDEWRLGFQKIIAGLLGVNLDDLVRRDVQRRRTRLAFTAVAGLLLAGTSILGVLRWQSDLQAQRLAADAKEGLTALRTGDEIAGIDRFARAIHALGEQRAGDDADLAALLLNRLQPLDQALGEVENGRMTNWRGRTYLMWNGAPQPWGPANLYADLGPVLVTWSSEQGFATYLPPDPSPLWTIKTDLVEIPCALWFDETGPRLWVEGTRIGTTTGSSYGYSGWLDVRSGDFSASRRSEVESVCGASPATASDVKAMTRVEVSVSAFDWPRLQRESRYWQPERLEWPAGTVPPTEIRARLGRFADGDSPDEPSELEWLVASNRVRIALGCATEAVLFGERIPGNSGGEWFRCLMSENGACEFNKYPGEILGWSASPDCATVVATGVGLQDNLGLLAIRSDGAILPIRNAVRNSAVSRGTFSPDGSSFAAYTETNRIQVFRREDDELYLVGQHNVGNEVRSLVLLDDKRLAALLYDGRLVLIKAETGQIIWSSDLWADLFDERVDWRMEGRESPRGSLVADEAGRWLALAVIVPEARIVENYPDWTLKRLALGGGNRESNKSFEGLVSIIDAESGVPVGLPFSVINALGGEDVPDAWDAASLSVVDEGSLLFSFPPYGAYRSVPPKSVRLPLEVLTGMGPDGPLVGLPFELVPK